MSDDILPLKDAEFRYIADLLYQRFGIHLSDQKKILVAGRLTRRLKLLGLSSFALYIEYLKSDHSGQELSELINRITTNHTYFLRENEHFEFMRQQVLPEIDRRMPKGLPYPLRIWSAGCATGEEIYTLAMLLCDYYQNRMHQIDAGLLATDISMAALTEARNAVYSLEKAKSIPPEWIRRYLEKETDESCRIKAALRQMVLFKRLNLMSDSYPMKGKFDCIFCRNVMIYFDQESRQKVVNTLYKYIKPGGYLFIGHSESLKRESCPFRYIKPAVYQRPGLEASCARQ